MISSSITRKSISEFQRFWSVIFIFYFEKWTRTWIKEKYVTHTCARIQENLCKYYQRRAYSKSHSHARVCVCVCTLLLKNSSQAVPLNRIFFFSPIECVNRMLVGIYEYSSLLLSFFFPFRIVSSFAKRGVRCCFFIFCVRVRIRSFAKILFFFFHFFIGIVGIYFKILRI